MSRLILTRCRLQAIIYSIAQGAIDNASGVTSMIQMVLDNPETLSNCLYVFAGNEELAYDYPIYWGYGYRQFEKKYNNLINDAKRVLVLDSFGHSEPLATNDPDLVYLGFPIKSFNENIKKIFMIHGDIDILMSVYHSDLDGAHLIKEIYLKQAIKKALSLLK